MFGNDFIDYCATNWFELVKISNSQFDELVMHHLNDYTKVFVSFYRTLQAQKSIAIPVSTFLEMGIDFTRLCLLVFLVFAREGNTTIKFSPDMKTITYR